MYIYIVTLFSILAKFNVIFLKFSSVDNSYKKCNI